CPVVAYPGGSVAEIVDDGGTIVPDGDVDALTAACLRLAASESYRAEMGTCARHRAEAFDVQRSVEQLVVEYRDIVGDRRKATEPQNVRSIRSTWLTINPNLEASARSLQDWIRLGGDRGMTISVVLQKRGDLSRRLEDRAVPYVVNAMYWPDRSRFLK